MKTDRLARHDYLHIYDVRVQLPPISEAGPSEQWQQQFNAIGTKETKVEPVDGLSTKDSVLLAKADIDSDDIDEVIDFAKYRKISISDALKNTTLKLISWIRDSTYRKEFYKTICN